MCDYQESMWKLLACGLYVPFLLYCKPINLLDSLTSEVSTKAPVKPRTDPELNNMAMTKVGNCPSRFWGNGHEIKYPKHPEGALVDE
jgi:hypothetical protein